MPPDPRPAPETPPPGAFPAGGLLAVTGPDALDPRPLDDPPSWPDTPRALLCLPGAARTGAALAAVLADDRLLRALAERYDRLLWPAGGWGRETAADIAEALDRAMAWPAGAPLDVIAEGCGLAIAHALIGRGVRVERLISLARDERDLSAEVARAAGRALDAGARDRALALLDGLALLRAGGGSGLLATPESRRPLPRRTRRLHLRRADDPPARDAHDRVIQPAAEEADLPLIATRAARAVIRDALAPRDVPRAGSPEVRPVYTRPVDLTRIGDGGRLHLPHGFGIPGKNAMDAIDAIHGLGFGPPQTISPVVPSTGDATPPDATVSHDATPTHDIHLRAAPPAAALPETPCPLLVTLAREAMRAVGAEVVSGAVPVRPAAPLFLVLMPVDNVTVLGADEVELALPEAGHPRDVCFWLRPGAPGKALAVLLLHQLGAPLVRLRVEIPVVASRDALLCRDIEPVAVPALPPPEIRPRAMLMVVEEPLDAGHRYLLTLEGEGATRQWTRRFKRPRGAYIDGFYARIRAFARSGIADAERHHDELVALGHELAEQLLPDEMRRVLWRHRAALEGLCLFSDEPDVPWECVCLLPTDPSDPGAPVFLAELGMTRSLLDVSLPATLPMRPGRAWVVAPDHREPGRRLPAADDEVHWIEAHLNASPVDGSYADLMALLSRRDRFDLLHVVSHGTADRDRITESAILLEGDALTPNVLAIARCEADGFVDGSAPASGGPVVFLNACSLGLQGRLLARDGGWPHSFLSYGARAFIAPLWTVADHTARLFAEAFYGALLDGETVAGASRRARAAARRGFDITWLAYAIYALPDARLQPAAAEPEA